MSQATPYGTVRLQGAVYGGMTRVRANAAHRAIKALVRMGATLRVTEFDTGTMHGPQEGNRMDYKAQSARDAQASGFGDKSYWDYLEQAAQEYHDYYMRHGDSETAARMFTRSLSESLMGNDGD